MIAASVILAFGTTLAVMLLRRRWRDRRAVAAVMVALVAAGAGYAATGRPSLASAPARAVEFDLASQSAFETTRQSRLQRFGEVGAWLTFADALIRAGATGTAVRALQQIVGDRPDTADLWIGLGNALAMHGEAVGAASRLAFARAAAIDPDNAQPAFFLGLAELETGDARGAAATWRALKLRSLPDADLDRWLAVADRRAASQPG